MSYTFVKNYQQNDALRASFNGLATQTFGINFEDWHKNGFWGDEYTPYSFLDNGEVVANTSASLMHFLIDGAPKTAVQIGTVMTHDTHRGKGLAKRLLRQLLDDFENQCDFFFLYANDNVLGFYPAFKFKIAEETAYKLQNPYHSPVDLPMHKLNLTNAIDFAIFKHLTLNTAVNQRVFLQNKLNLSMFHCGSYLQNDIYFFPTINAAAIYTKADNEIQILEVLAKDTSATLIIATSLQKEFRPKKLSLHFTPASLRGFIPVSFKEDDSTLFMRGASLPKNSMFPALAHT